MPAEMVRALPADRAFGVVLHVPRYDAGDAAAAWAGESAMSRSEDPGHRQGILSRSRLPKRPGRGSLLLNFEGTAPIFSGGNW